MQWTKRGAHLLLQIRTRALDGTLRPLFEQWYPGLADDNSPAGSRRCVNTPHIVMLSYLDSFITWRPRSENEGVPERVPTLSVLSLGITRSICGDYLLG
jgi:hypothetical protein